ncbi:MAG TPA: HAMP domain-containing sensor histidine kinase [Coriobacteriia bacterium]
MKRIGLGVQLGFAFAVVAASTALLVAIVMSVTWQGIFESYVRERVQDSAATFANMAGASFVTYGRWDSRGLFRLSAAARSYSLRAQVIDAHDVVLADSSYLTGEEPLPGVAGGVQTALPTTGSPAPMSEPVVTAPVYVGSVRVGSVRVASASPGSLLTDSDTQFRDASSSGLALAAVLAVALATAGGLLYSRVFARPIERVTRAAAALRAGDRDARTGMSGDDPMGVLGKTLDEMAESIQAERESERRLTADVAHELRTPLQAIQATVEAIQDGVLPADGEHLGIVRDETVRLGRLADSILELSRLENRSVQFRLAPVDPSVALHRAVDSHRALLESLELTLDTDIAEGATVSADLDRLTQAFSNLLGNAARYTPAGGSVQVKLVCDPKQATISVRDSGIGIPEDQHDRVFTRFWRSEAARERSRSGFGVGLAMVREIVEQHEGSVAFHSNDPDPGTTFEIRLPLVKKRQKV